MKNPTFQILFISIACGMSLSCTSPSNDSENSNDSIASVNRSGSLDSGLPDNDSVLNYRNGVAPNVEEGSSDSDSLKLPNSVLEAIKNDTDLKNSKIVDMKESMENGVSIYEIVFFPVNGKEEKVTFDAQGKRKSKP